MGDDREKFRAEVLKVNNKKQEALLKRRYLLKEIVDTERGYIRDLKIVNDKFVNYVSAEEEFVTKSVKDTMDILMGKIKYKRIFTFHDSQFLQELEDCTGAPLKIGSTFLKHRADFEVYVT